MTVQKRKIPFPRRLYTIDMGLGADGLWRVFELNTKPGFSPMETGRSYAAFYGKLADFLLAACAVA